MQEQDCKKKITIHLHNGKVVTVREGERFRTTKDSIDVAMRKGWKDQTIGYRSINDSVIVPTNAIEAIYIRDDEQK